MRKSAAPVSKPQSQHFEKHFGLITCLSSKSGTSNPPAKRYSVFAANTTVCPFGSDTPISRIP